MRQEQEQDLKKDLKAATKAGKDVEGPKCVAELPLPVIPYVSSQVIHKQCIDLNFVVEMSANNDSGRLFGR